MTSPWRPLPSSSTDEWSQPDQLRRIEEKAAEKGVTKGQLWAYTREHFRKAKLEDLTATEASTLLRYLLAYRPARHSENADARHH